MKIIKRWVKIILGGVITVIGIILMPVPGPGGTPVTLAGLAILGSELPWAKRIMEKLQERVKFFQGGKNKRWKVAIMIGLLCFYVATSVIIYQVWAVKRIF